MLRLVEHLMYGHYLSSFIIELHALVLHSILSRGQWVVARLPVIGWRLTRVAAALFAYCNATRCHKTHRKFLQWQWLQPNQSKAPQQILHQYSAHVNHHTIRRFSIGRNKHCKYWTLNFGNHNCDFRNYSSEMATHRGKKFGYTEKKVCICGQSN